MIVHPKFECEEWTNYRHYYPLNNKIFMFEPKINGKLILQAHIVDIPGKAFQHNADRVFQNIIYIFEKYPLLKPIVESNDFHLFFCPKPAVDTANACAYTKYICLFSRGTQIPYCMTDYIIGHELGHVVQFNMFDDGDVFSEYIKLRAPHLTDDMIDDMCHKLSSLPWDENPREWFAEDFRYLFGTDQGDKFWGLPIESPDYTVKEFLLTHMVKS